MRSTREYIMTYEAKDLASELDQHHKRFVSSAHNPVYKMWLRNLYAYYSTVLDAQTWMSALNFVGEQGELVKMSIPQARSLLRQLLTLVTKQRLAFNAIAETSGSDVTEEMKIANALSTHIVDSQSLDIKIENLVETGLVLGTSFLATRWRTDLGKPIAVQDGNNGKSNVIYEGDLDMHVASVFDMTFDFTNEKWEDQNWAELRVKRNRWDLIAQHPELEEFIIKLPSVNRDLRTRTTLDYDDHSTVYVYEMYHKPTPALPRGRMLMYSDKHTIYHDDINEYGCIPIEQFKPEPISGLGYGYPMLSNLLPSQEMFDHSYSCLATNQSSLGVQNIATPRGAETSVHQLHGMNFFDYTPVANAQGGGKPEPIDLLKSAPELFKLPEMLLSNMQQISFMNAAIRGEIPGGASGVAIATMTTNALEFLNSYMKSVQKLLERSMYHGINAYRKFANTPRLVTLTGNNYQSLSKEFTGKTLEPITNIRIDSVNPLMQTIAGRIDIAEKTLDKGLVKDFQAYVSILDGQPLSRLYPVESSENDLIESENEMLQEGKEVPVLSVDKHPLHIYRHKALLNDPRVRMDSPKVQLILAHIEQHNQLAQSTDPMLMAMANTGVMPEMPAPMPQQAPGGASPAGPPGQEENQAPPGLVGVSMKEAKPSLMTAPDLLGRQ